MKKGIYKKCQKCKGEFYIYPYLIGSKNEPKVCSFKCRLKGENRNCIFCNKEFYALPSQIKKGWGKFCSQSCRGKIVNSISHLGRYAQKGTPAPKTAFRPTGLRFKGTMKEYKHLHYWVNKNLGKPLFCEKCGSNQKIEWANRSNDYLKDLLDWIALCRKCHFIYDNQEERRGYAFAS